MQCLLDLQAAAGLHIDVDMEDVHPTVATVISQPRGPHEYQLVPVSHPVYVDRVVERVVPIYVPIPVEQRVPFPVYVPMPVHTSQYVLNQYLHMVAGNTPPRHRPDEPSEVEGFQRPRLEQQPRACLTWREDSQQPILLPWRQQPILLPWHEPPAKQAGTSSQLSQKRRARLKPYERTEAEEVLSQKLEVFRRENDWVERRKMWDEWSPQMRAHAIYRSTVSVRTRLKEWREEDEASSTERPVAPNDGSSSSNQVASSQATGCPLSTQGPEVSSHNWLEGARIGEAQNPGPKGQANNGPPIRAPWRQPWAEEVSDDGPWGPKRRKPGERSVAQQATSSPPHHKGPRSVQSAYQNSASWGRPAPGGTGLPSSQSPPCATCGSSLAPDYDGRQCPIPRQRGSPPEQRNKSGGLRAANPSTNPTNNQCSTADVLQDILKGLQRLEHKLHPETPERTQVGWAVSALMRMQHTLQPVEKVARAQVRRSLHDDNQWKAWGAHKNTGQNPPHNSMKQHPSPRSRDRQSVEDRAAMASKGQRRNEVQRPVAGVVDGEPAPTGFVHSHKSFSHFPPRGRTATGASTPKGPLASWGTPWAEAEPPCATNKKHKPKTKGTPRGNNRQDAGNSGHPTTGGKNVYISIAPLPPARDARPLPYPLHGKLAHEVHLSSGRMARTWDSWRG